MAKRTHSGKGYFQGIRQSSAGCTVTNWMEIRFSIAPNFLFGVVEHRFHVIRSAQVIRFTRGDHGQKTFCSRTQRCPTARGNEFVRLPDRKHRCVLHRMYFAVSSHHFARLLDREILQRCRSLHLHQYDSKVVVDFAKQVLHVEIRW